MLYRDQDPANQNHLFDLRIARLGPVDSHLLHEGAAVDIRSGVPAGDKLEQIGEHFGARPILCGRSETQRGAANHSTRSRSQLRGQLNHARHERQGIATIEVHLTIRILQEAAESAEKS
jgi:hypothetical protein